MLVKVRKPIQGYGYFGGEVIEVTDAIASSWIEIGYAILVQPTEGDDSDLPDGLPSRHLLIGNGFASIKQILDAGDALTDIKGIGAKGAEAIITFCNEYQNSTK